MCEYLAMGGNKAGKVEHDEIKKIDTNITPLLSKTELTIKLRSRYGTF